MAWKFDLKGTKQQIIDKIRDANEPALSLTQARKLGVPDSLFQACAEAVEKLLQEVPRLATSVTLYVAGPAKQTVELSVSWTMPKPAKPAKPKPEPKPEPGTGAEPPPEPPPASPENEGHAADEQGPADAAG